MSRPGFEVLLYALVAALSPLALASTLVVLRSERGRLNGSAFALGVLLGQSLVFLVAFVIGVASVEERRGGHPLLDALFELAVGVVLLVAAARTRQHREPRPHHTSPRTQAVLDKLKGLKTPAAFGAGALLGVGGPKRLVITVLAAATISASGLASDGKLIVGVIYVLLATVLVWAPVALYVVAGERAGRWMAGAREWLTAYRRTLTYYPLVVLGLIFVADAIIRLV
jgi:Sap, sulfolipid-1-addressing protein